MVRPSQASCKVFGATARLFIPEQRPFLTNPIYLAFIFPAVYLKHHSK
jgi:hypothetical protein